ncbi:hypothetical protein KY335_04740 [Candidatus Woesearchaeota archaeon]|nr:hypothetical protein [Candidatus Woesearchaeota archaeon]MBW3014515.1 hypothetical protein [Candidatus Woesearchaeota archaeon]
MKIIDVIIVLIIALLVIALVMIIFFPKIKHADDLTEGFVEKTLEEHTAAEIDPAVVDEIRHVVAAQSTVTFIYERYDL